MKISVVIPLYNKREGILRALQSVFEQTVQPLEIVIVNDGSTDGSEQLVTSLNHPLIRLFHQKNTGVSAARNKGIAEAKGEWISFLDADDEWYPEYLETMYSLAESYPQCNILAAAYDLQDHTGNRKPIVLNKISFTGRQGILSNYFEVASCSHPPISSISITLKREALLSISGFPLGVKSGEDLLTWARLATRNEIAYSLKPMSVFIQDAAHTYDDGPNRVPDNPDLVGNELIHLFNENLQNRYLKRYVSHWFKMRASIFLRLGLGSKSIKESLKAIRFYPGNKKVYIYLFLSVLPLKMRNQLFKQFGA